MRKHFLFSLVMTVAFTSALFQMANAQNTSPYWSVAGNSNATTSSKLGTTTAIPLRLTTNNSTRIYISPNAGNVGIGTTSPVQKFDVNGNINLAKGYGLYMENHRVLRVDSANNNIFLGNGIGVNNTGFFNTATGASSLSANTAGNSNTATGTWSLRYNTTGSGNVANGVYALYSNTTGYSNVATGYSALSRNFNGSYNSAFGENALYLNTAGSHNTAAGSAALIKNTTGGYNTAVGYEALYGNISGGENTAIGYHTLDATEGSWGNTAIGSHAGHTSWHGWNNTFIGAYATGTHSDNYNSVALGSSATVTASNQVRIGNSYTTSIGGYTNWTNISDGRVKKNIQENVPGLAFINKLKPVTYNLDLDAADKISGIAAAKDKNGKPLVKQSTQMEIAARTAKQQVVYTGFIAQEVEKAARELNYNFSGVDAAKNEKDLYGLRYIEFVMPLVKAVQELSKKDEELQQKTAEIDELKNDIAELRRMVQALTKGTVRDVALPSVTLGQNSPNPATGSTRISYVLPNTTARAQLLLTDATGKMVKTIALDGSGVVNINTAAFSAGAYTYSLLIDGKIAATKKLTVAR